MVRFSLRPHGSVTSGACAEGSGRCQVQAGRGSCVYKYIPLASIIHYLKALTELREQQLAEAAQAAVYDRRL